MSSMPDDVDVYLGKTFRYKDALGATLDVDIVTNDILISVDDGGDAMSVVMLTPAQVWHLMHVLTNYVNWKG